MLKSPSQSQIDEWIESEVTQFLLKTLEKRLDIVFKARSEVFFPGEPYKTQESKANLLGEEGAISDVVEALRTRNLGVIEEMSDE